MKFTTKFNLRLLFTAVMGVMVIFSCKKDDNNGSSSGTNYMTGSLNFVLPQYTNISEKLDLEATGITAPETGITYEWETTGFSVEKISGQKVEVFAPATHGSYTVKITASADGYSSKTLSKTIIVIDPTSQESLKGIVNGEFSYTDLRDGKKYYYSKINGLDWFTSNLDWEGKGKTYKEADALGPIYGRLYTWDEANTGENICPIGWRVPTNSDWESLAMALNNGTHIAFDSNWEGLGGKITVNASLNGDQLWKYSPNNEQKNTFSLNALPGGYSTTGHTVFKAMKEYGFWWSATEKDASNGYYRYIYFDNGDFPYNYTGKDSFGASVRCVRTSK